MRYEREGEQVSNTKRPPVGFRIFAVILAAVLAYLIITRTSGSEVLIYGEFAAIVVTFIVGDTKRPTGSIPGGSEGGSE